MPTFIPRRFSRLFIFRHLLLGLLALLTLPVLAQTPAYTLAVAVGTSTLGSSADG
ncbi:hypothetical protein [Hymenobacter cellulosivorans]|uniref:Uncharacterized protein n=1 Tax=Hymenobacter cellulosivorans TaxID=2932249 RepID=A0ABY4FEC4_9BACT|nr:hypothetical protein [Hymenobacter cellulosivorans]UOQ54853.1 hypothetical protein MUN80_08860 [Hymenobacter cellulosivorans]